MDAEETSHVSFEHNESRTLTLPQQQRDRNIPPKVQDLVQVPEPNVCNISMVGARSIRQCQTTAIVDRR
jgi:hypothetical protein